MSSYTTTNITRLAAKQAIMRKILSDITDDELERMVDEMIFERRLRKCRVVNDDDENEDELLS